jgi:hypothetical protein
VALDQDDSADFDMLCASLEKRAPLLLLGVDEVAHQQDTLKAAAEAEAFDRRAHGRGAAHVREHLRRLFASPCGGSRR